MARSATLALKITGDARDGIRALDDTESRAGKAGKALGGALALGAGAGIAAIGLLGKASFDAASELQQSTGAIESVFGKMADKMETSAKKADKAVGLSTSAYENLAAVLGAQLKGAGLPIDQVADKTQTLIEKGADLAATFGGTTADAVEALSSVLKGETDPIERYGVSLKQSDINARLAALGQDKLTGSALKTATANAALALVMDQTKDATGAFGRESDTAAGASQRLGAWWENLKATLGEQLLPVFTAVTDFMSQKVVPVIEDLTRKGGPLATALTDIGIFVTDKVIPALSSLWDELSPKLIPVLQTIRDIIVDDVVPAFEKLWKFTTDYIIPIVRDTLKPALDGVNDALKNIKKAIDDNKDSWEAFAKKVKPVADFLRDYVAPIVGVVLKLQFEQLGTVISSVIKGLAWIIDHGKQLSNVLSPLHGIDPLSWFGSANPSAAGATMGAVAGPGLFGAARGGLLAAASPLGGGGSGPSAAAAGSLPAGGTVVNVTINGALDPVAVGRQLEGVLRDYGRSTGRQLAFNVGRVA